MKNKQHCKSNRTDTQQYLQEDVLKLYVLRIAFAYLLLK